MAGNYKFEEQSKAKANLKAGALYAVDGQDGYIYYAQVSKTKDFGFFNYRSIELELISNFIQTKIMSRFLVSMPSIGRALREGAWLYLGKELLNSELEVEAHMVQWSVGTIEVEVWCGSEIIKSTTAFDPEIQNLEIIAAYDAIYHAPKRLSADFISPFEGCLVGGSVFRERLNKEYMANKFPEAPWHQLPKNWVYIK